MSEAEEQELLRLESQMIEVLTDLARFRIRTSQKTPRDGQSQPDLPSDLIELGAAAQLAEKPSDTVRAWCRANLLDAGGFAIKLRGSRWYVSRRPFLDFVRNRR